MKSRLAGTRKVFKEIDLLKKKLGLSVGEFADIAAKTVRDTVVRNAQPFGNGKKAFQKGKGAIRKDLLKVFQIVPESARGQRGVITSASQAARVHKSRRGGNGRTRRGKREKILPSVFRSYAEEVSKNIGIAKGSVMGDDDSRLRSRFPSWVKRWKSAGKSKRRRKPGGAVWKFDSKAKHAASSRVLGDRGVKRVMARKDGNLKRVLNRRMKRELKKSEKRANR